MAENNGVHLLRRLRGREIVVQPQPQLQQGPTNPRGKNKKAVVKRAAVDENSRSSGTEPQAKKRAVLGNLTNVPTSSSLHDCIAMPRVATRKVTLVATDPSNGKPFTAGLDDKAVCANSSRILDPLTVKEEDDRENDENACPGQFPNNINVKPETVAGGIQVDKGVRANSGRCSDKLTVKKEDHRENNENACSGQPAYNANAKPEVIADRSAKCARGSALSLRQDAPKGSKQETEDSQHGLHRSRGPVCSSVKGENVVEGLANTNYLDIDIHKDPQLCSTYAVDIYHHLRSAELKRRPTTNFMETVQHGINPSMRGILVDWLVEVAEEYKLVPDTLYLAVSYIDRFLSKNPVSRQQLQLLGVSCMLIASKYEEICAPQVEEFCYITDNTYNRGEVLEMETRVLNHLQFELSGPTTKSFLRRFIRAAQPGLKTSGLQLEFLGNYLCELTLLEYDFLRYLPSMVAASAVFLAKVTVDPTSKPWNPTLQHYTGYRPSELKVCIQAVHALQRNTKNCTLPAIREKFRQHKFKCVSTIESPVTIPEDYFDDIQKDATWTLY